MAGEIYLSNLSGQFDYQQILDKYEELKYQQVSIIQQREDQVVRQKSAFRSYANMLEDFQKSFDSLSDDTLFDKKIVNVSDESVASVSINDPAKVNPTKLDFTVKQLAANDVWLSQSGVANSTDTVASSDGTLTLTIDGQDYSIDYTTNDTLQDIATKINQATDKANASIFFDGTNYRLILSSSDTGTNNAITMSDSGDLLDNLQLGDNYTDSHVQEAQNAQLDIYGQTVESQTNTFSNVIDGIDITAKAVSNTPVAIDIQNDDNAVKSALEDLFSKYNSLVDYAKEQTSEGGPLSGDFTLQSIRSALFQRLTPLMEKNLIDVDHTNGHISLRSSDFDTLISSDKEALKTTINDIEASMQPYLDALFDTDGIINQKEKSYDNKINRYEDDIQRTLERITQESDNLKQQFIHLDGVLAQLNDMKTQLSAILPKDQQ